MQDISYPLIKKSLSAERLGSYARHDGASDQVALARYQWNIAVSASLYSSLQLCEVSLRNALHFLLSQEYGETWYEGSELRISEWGRKEVAKVQRQLTKSKKTITPSRVVAELQFGFWTHLFQHDYQSPQGFLPKHIKGIFPHLEKSRHKPKQIKRDLDAIRILRNRIFHHERIIHWKDLDAKHDLILDVIHWSSPQLHTLAKTLDTYPECSTRGYDPFL